MSAALAVAAPAAEHLPALVDRAAAALTNARSSAEVLEASEMAGFAYDAAKRAGRLARAKEAHDELIGAVYRAQADALLIESEAKRRLADEYDVAQERGEVAGQGKPVNLPDGNVLPTAADIGLTPKAVHEARVIRDAEAADPGIVRRALDERIERGEEPTKAHLRQIVTEAALRGLRGPRSPDRRNPFHEPNPQSDVMLGLTGNCRSIITALNEYAPDYILGAFRDDGQRRRNLATIVECRDALAQFLEAADVEEART